VFADQGADIADSGSLTRDRAHRGNRCYIRESLSAEGFSTKASLAVS
jgi:hypothetical protein